MDSIAFYVIIIQLCFPVAVLSPEAEKPEAYRNVPFDGFGWNLDYLLFYILNYVLFEFLTRWRTPGKLIAGNRAVMADGSGLNFGASLK